MIDSSCLWLNGYIGYNDLVCQQLLACIMYRLFEAILSCCRMSSFKCDWMSLDRLHHHVFWFVLVRKLLPTRLLIKITAQFSNINSQEKDQYTYLQLVYHTYANLTTASLLNWISQTFTKRCTLLETWKFTVYFRFIFAAKQINQINNLS